MRRNYLHLKPFKANTGSSFMDSLAKNKFENFLLKLRHYKDILESPAWLTPQAELQGPEFKSCFTKKQSFAQNEAF